MADNEINGINLNSTADPNITALTNAGSQGSAQGLAQTYGQPGQQAATGLLNRPSNYNDSLGYGNSADLAAIRQKYMGQYNIQNNALDLETMRNATSDRLANLAATSQLASQEVEQNRQKALLRWQIDQQNRKARGAILGTVLGIVGGVAGGVAGGYATGGIGAVGGAAAGFKLGEGAGNMIGGGY